MLKVIDFDDHFFFIDDELFFGEFEYDDKDVEKIEDDNFKVKGTLYLKEFRGKRKGSRPAILYVCAESLDGEWFDFRIIY